MAVLFLSIWSCCAFLFAGCKSDRKSTNGTIKIIWVNNLPGDFSFTTKWNYPEGVYKNKYGQLSCDAFCPPETDKMKDASGKISSKDLDAFYQLVDTTHRYFTIKSESNAYEWAGTNYIRVTRKGNKLVGETETNAATHSVLVLKIDDDNCIPEVQLNSISSVEATKFLCKAGVIRISRSSCNRGILQASFSFNFEDPQRKTPIWWKGKIYSPIKEK